MLGVVLAESLILIEQMPAGLTVHAVVLLGTLGLVSVTEGETAAYEAMVFVPLLRLINLGTGDLGLHPYLWLALIYLLTLTAIAFVMPTHGYTAGSIGLWPPPSGRKRQAVLVGVGIGLALGAVQWVLSLESSPVEVTPPNALLAVLVVGLLVGFVEELLFRGVLQPAASDVIGTAGAIVAVSVVFGFMHSVWLEPLNVVFAFCVSLYLGLAYARTRNFWHIWVVHAFINIGAYAVFPMLFGGSP